MQTKQNIMKTSQTLPQLHRARLKMPMLMLLALFAMLLGAMTASAALIVTSSGSPTVYGASVTFTATVAPNTFPAGTDVYFYADAGVPIGVVTVSGSTTSNVIYTTTTPLAAGSHSIWALNNFAFSPLITQVVNQKALTITPPTIADKTYDGTATAGAVTVGALSGFVVGETVTATGSAANYPSPSVGTYNNVVITYTLHDGTGLAANYSLANGTASGKITGTALTVVGISAVNKVYNGTNSATLNFVNANLVGVDTNDIVSLDTTSALGAFDNKNIGTNKTVTVSGLGLLGPDAPKYSLTQPTNASANIAAKALTVTGATVTPKAYDGTLSAVITNAALSGVVGTEVVTLANASTGTFDTKYVGTGKSVATLPMTITGADIGNYTLTQPTLTGNITAKPLNITANPDSKTYGQTNVYGTNLVAFTTGPGELISPDSVTSVTLACTDGATNTARVGSYNIIPSAAVGSGLTNYTISYNNGTLTVNPAPLSVLAANASRVYGQTNPVFTVTYSGFVNGETNTVLGGTLTYDCLAVTNSPIGPYPIVPRGLTATNYSIHFTASFLTVLPNTLTVTADDKTKFYGQPDPTFTASYSGFVNGDTVTNLGGTLVFTRVPGENAGTYAITPSGLTSTTNYSITFSNGTLTIQKTAVTVVANPKSMIYGGTNPTLTATVTGINNNDTILYRLDTAATNTSGVGSYPITVTVTLGTNNTNYIVTATNSTLTVNQKGATVAADPKSKPYGSANPTLTATVTGTANGDTLNYTLTTDATTNSIVGDYLISVGMGSNPNYNVTVTYSTLSVYPAGLTVQALDANRAYGLTNPVFKVTYFGFVNGETNTVLGGTLTNTCLAVTNSPIGTYPIVPSGLTATNYSITYTNGTLTVQPYALTVTADDKTKFYGQPDPTFTASYKGFVNGDTVTNLGGTLSFNRTAGGATNDPAGPYPIIPSGLTSPNYAINFSNGTLTIVRAIVVVSANPTNKYYGAANPVLTATITGAVTNNPPDFKLETTATNNSTVGSYPITVTLGTNNTNYEVRVTNSTLTVLPKAAVVFADHQNKSYGDANPTLTATVTGTNYSDTINYTLSTTATTNSFIGNYPITVALGINTNYSVTVSNNNLTVGQRAATVVANPKGKNYGSPNPTLDAIVAGTVNRDMINYSLATTAVLSSPAGSYPITVSLGSNPNYTVTATTNTLTVQPNTLTVTADNKTKYYGQPDPTNTASYVGFVNGDTVTNLGGVLQFTRDPGEVAGTYAITNWGLTSTNYTINYTNGTLTIAKATVTVVANPKSKTYGDTNPTLTATLTGTNNSDTILYRLDTAATNTSDVGPYPITVTLGTNNTNYIVTATNSTLTVNQKDATVRANDKTKQYGDANPSLDATVSGMVNGNWLNYSLTTAATTISGVGTYAITVMLWDNPNYNITRTDGSLTVGQTVALVSANPTNRPYGNPNPTFHATVTGAVNGDTLNYILATTAVPSSPLGTYPITVTLLDNPNYAVTAATNTLTVGKRTALVAANPKTKVYGDNNPPLDATVTGVVLGDELNYTLATTAATNSPLGPYPITVTLGANTNYNVTATNSTLTITRATSVTKQVSSKNPSVLGSNVTFTATVTLGTNAVVLPTGTVQFYANNSPIGTPVTLASGVASISRANLPVGITIVYAIFVPSDGNVYSSLDIVEQTVHLFQGTPTTDGIRNNGDGTVTVSFTGTPYGSYVVQASDSLNPPAWANISTNTTGSDGKWTIVGSMVGRPTKYYRSVNP